MEQQETKVGRACDVKMKIMNLGVITPSSTHI